VAWETNLSRTHVIAGSNPASPTTKVVQNLFMAKVKVSIAIDEKLAKEIDSYLRELVMEAAKSGKPIPKQSNVYEEIVWKGWEVVKKERKK